VPARAWEDSGMGARVLHGNRPFDADHRHSGMNRNTGASR
jgi:hypothetical protein